MKIKVKITGSNLILTIDIEDRAELYVSRIDNPNYFASNEAMYDIFEWLICNSEYDWISPQEIGALTDAPILGIKIYKDDYSDEVKDILAWGYEPYMIRSPQDDLADYGKVIFVDRF